MRINSICIYPIPIKKIIGHDIMIQTNLISVCVIGNDTCAPFEIVQHTAAHRYAMVENIEFQPDLGECLASTRR